eukprot:114078-Pelagomonas_calceolata.AAC.4
MHTHIAIPAATNNTRPCALWPCTQDKNEGKMVVTPNKPKSPVKKGASPTEKKATQKGGGASKDEGGPETKKSSTGLERPHKEAAALVAHQRCAGLTKEKHRPHTQAAQAAHVSCTSRTNKLQSARMTRQGALALLGDAYRFACLQARGACDLTGPLNGIPSHSQHLPCYSIRSLHQVNQEPFQHRSEPFNFEGKSESRPIWVRSLIEGKAEAHPNKSESYPGEVAPFTATME